ncbi:MAG: deoxyribodipyrimidine photo-lyase, partial [Bacilli bacterium]
MNKANIELILNKNQYHEQGEYILYLISSSLFIENNATLNQAIILSKIHHRPVYPIFLLNTNFPQANYRNMSFLVEGLIEFQMGLQSLNLDLFIYNETEVNIKEILNNAYCIVSDNVYMPYQVQKRNNLFKQYPFQVIIYENNLVVPNQTLYPKMAYNAYSIRKRIHLLYNENNIIIPMKVTLKNLYQPHLNSL